MASAERTARLELLEKAVKEWGDKEEARILRQAEAVRRLLRGRTGSDQLRQTLENKADALFVAELDDFLGGST